MRAERDGVQAEKRVRHIGRGDGFCTFPASQESQGDGGDWVAEEWLVDPALPHPVCPPPASGLPQLHVECLR